MATYQEKAYLSSMKKASASCDDIAEIYGYIISYIEDAKKNHNSKKRFVSIDKAIKIADLLSKDLLQQQQNTVNKSLTMFYLSLIQKLHEIKFSNNTDEYKKIINNIQLLQKEWRKISIPKHQNKTA